MASLTGTLNRFLGFDEYGDMSNEQIQLAQLKKQTINQPKWAMEGMQNAGLNPILAVGGAHSATTADNVGNYDLSSNIKGITSAVKAGAKIAMAIATKNPGLLFDIPKRGNIGFGK